MSGSIFDALTDPRTAALMGLTAGFGEAAMPTRMPIPLGAALAKGVSGMLPAIQQAQQTRMGNIQQQQAQIGLDWYKNAMQPGGGGAPFGAPSAGGDMNNQYLVPPKMLASMIPMMVAQGKDPSGIAKLVESYSGGQGYAMGPQGTAFAVPGGLADPGVVGRKAQAAATGTGMGELPFKPPQSYDMPITDAAGKPVLDASGQPTFRKQIMTAPQINQTAANGLNPTMADPFRAWATQINHGENGTGNPAAKNASGPGGTPTSSAMGNGQFIDGTWRNVIGAVRPDLASSMSDQQLMGLRANPDLAQQATEQYARMNGSELARAGLPVNGGTVALAHFLGPGGARTVLSATPDAPIALLPGMGAAVAANPSLRNMTAGQLVQKYQRQMGGQSGGSVPGVAGLPVQTAEQEAQLKVNTARAMPYDLRTGGMHVDPTTQSVVKNPELRQIELPSGQKPFVHINPPSPFAVPGTPGEASNIDLMSPGGQPAPGSPMVGNAIPHDVQEGRNEVVKEFNTKDAASYQSAQNVQAWVKQITHAADTLNDGSPLYQTGPYGETRLGAMAGVNDFLASVGVKPFFDVNKIAAAEEIKKAQTTGGFELAAAFEGHSKQAASTIMNATTAIPGMHNTPAGLKLVASGINETSQFVQNEHEYKMSRFQGEDPYGLNPKTVGMLGGAGLQSAEVDFAKKFPPELYATRAISTQQPIPIKASNPEEMNRAFSKYLPGTQVMLNGVSKTIPDRPDAPPMPRYIIERLQQHAR